MRNRRKETELPGWLWFFLILPIGLIVALIYRRRRFPPLPRMTARAPRYTEPDSIPLDMSEAVPADVPYGSATGSQEAEEIGVDADDVAMAKASTDEPPAAEQAAAEENKPEAQQMAEDQEAKEDDLKVVEGIGPVIADLLYKHNIQTYRQLADTPVERLVEILTGARLNRLADPATWPEQAALAAEGKWEALEELKGTLNAGRRSRSKE